MADFAFMGHKTSNQTMLILNTLFIMIVYAHRPKLNNETGMTLHACFYFGDVKENRTKKKNEHGDICFLINLKFLCKIPFKVISFLFL